MSTPTPTGATPAGDPESPESSGRPWAPIAAVVAAIVVVGLIGFLVTQDSGEDTALLPGAGVSPSGEPPEDTVLPSEASPIPAPPENPSPVGSAPASAEPSPSESQAETPPPAAPPPPASEPAPAPEPEPQPEPQPQPEPEPPTGGEPAPQPPPPVPDAPDDAEQGGPGTVTTTDGQQLLPGVPSDLSPFAGATVDGGLVRVQQVVGDEAFWIGESASDRLLVVVASSGESSSQVSEGQTVSFRGTVEPNPDDPGAAFGVDDSEGLAQLQQQGHHLSTTQLSVS